MEAFEKFENAVFFKIFEIPSDRQLILVSNLTKIFFKKKIPTIMVARAVQNLGQNGPLRAGRLSNVKFFFLKLAQTYDKQMVKISERHLKPLLSNSTLTKFH